MNNNNLIPQAHVLTVDEQSKGGKRSAQVRQERQQLRKVVQDVISGTYTDEDGTILTGSELIGKRLAEVINDVNHKHWFDVIRLIVQITDSDKTEKELELLETQQQQKINNANREEENAEWLDGLSFKNLRLNIE